MNLISSEPDSVGKKNVLERVKQLTEFKWTPIRNMPTHIPNGTKEKYTFFSADKEVTGMPYSNNVANDKYICENVSFETLLSAVVNPDSVLYNKNLYGYRNSSTYYGIVCSGLVRHSLGIKERYSVKEFGTIPGMRKIADCNSYKADEIELCDILYVFCKTRVHVALITDILKNDAGEIVEIEVSEAVRPTCKRENFKVEEFFKEFSVFELWRYDYIDSVPGCEPGTNEILFENKAIRKHPDIAVDFGNKSNYFLGQETIISVFREEENNIKIYKDGSLLNEMSIFGKGNFSRIFDVGYYEIKLEGSDEVVKFCVNYPLITHTVTDGVITVKVDSGNDSLISHMDFMVKESYDDSKERIRLHSLKSEVSEAVPYYYHFSSLCKIRKLTDEEIKSGVIVAQIPENAGFFKITFKNKYGLWTHQMIKI